jgi:hypothetical protein
MNNGQESVAEEIFYLSKLACVNFDKFAHFLRGVKVDYAAGTDPTLLATFTVPNGATCILTFISLHTFPLFDDVNLVAAGGGDYRADDLDVSGTTKAWLEVNGVAAMSKDATAAMFCNRPILYAFNAGDVVEFWAQRIAGTIPTTLTVQFGFHGYLADTGLQPCLTTFNTRLEADFS